MNDLLGKFSIHLETLSKYKGRSHVFVQ